MSDSPDVPRDPDLSNLLALFGEQLLDGVRVMLPGVITAYDSTSQRATVQPLIQDVRLGEQAKKETKTIPPIHDVPVMFLGPARGRITWPVAAGDTCALFFASSSISRWVAAGGVSPLDPGDTRRHDLSDAVAVVGLHSPANPPTDAPTDAVVVHSDGGIKLGSSGASQAVVVQSALDHLGSALVTAIAAMLLSLDPAVSALQALQSALGTDPVTGRGWSAGTTKTKAE